MYLFSISHSICSLIIFFDGRNMFFKISTSSVCSAAFVMRLRIFMIFTIASCSERTNEARLYTFCHFPSYFVVAESNVIVQYKRALCYRSSYAGYKRALWHRARRSTRAPRLLGVLYEHCTRARSQIHNVFEIVTCTRSILSCIMPSFSSSRLFSVDSCRRPIKLIFPRFCSFPFLLKKIVHTHNGASYYAKGARKLHKIIVIIARHSH